MDRFYFTTLAFVPDPTRDDRLTVGVLVTNESGREARFRRLRGLRTRLRALAPWTEPAAVEQVIEDLAASIGGASLWYSDGPLSLAKLEHLASSHGNQLQFAAPRVFRAENVEAAARELSSLHLPGGQALSQQKPTRRALRRRIHKTLDAWDLGPYSLDSQRIRTGPSLVPHQADFWLVNGSVGAAFYALADDEADVGSITLRDSLPAVLEDFSGANPDFKVVAVHDDTDEAMAENATAFLRDRGIVVTSSSKLDELQPVLIQRLLPHPPNPRR